MENFTPDRRGRINVSGPTEVKLTQLRWTLVPNPRPSSSVSYRSVQRNLRMNPFETSFTLGIPTIIVHRTLVRSLSPCDLPVLTEDSKGRTKSRPVLEPVVLRVIHRCLTHKLLGTDHVAPHPSLFGFEVQTRQT